MTERLLLAQILAITAISRQAADSVILIANQACGDLLQFPPDAAAPLRARDFFVHPAHEDRHSVRSSGRTAARPAGLSGAISAPVWLSLPPDIEAGLLTPATEMQLLRIIQEVLNDIRKHAAVSQAQITFLADAEHVRVLITDEGVGFRVSDVSDPHGDRGPHLGLQIMRERAAAAGGQVDVRSAPGKGTQVSVVVPRVRSFPRTRPTARVIIADDHPWRVK